MHIPDGFISPLITLPAYGLAAPVWVWAARRHFGRASAESLPAIGALTAVAFAIQTITIPVPGGTSTHLVGVTLLALLHRPLVAFVCESLVLVVQALFFGAGGVTVLAVNALAMGLVGPVAGWLVYRLIHRASERVATFAAAWVGIQAATLVVAGVLALQHAIDPEYFPMPGAVTLTAMLLPSLTVTGVVEGLYTLFALSLLRRVQLRGLA
jgi:cobalt/nickel transport system permease protein